MLSVRSRKGEAGEARLAAFEEKGGRRSVWGVIDWDVAGGPEEAREESPSNKARTFSALEPRAKRCSSASVLVNKNSDTAPVDYANRRANPAFDSRPSRTRFHLGGGHGRGK